MNSSWRLVRLGEVAQPVERPEVPLPAKLYRQIGVRLWGEGAYERDSIDGAETRYQTLSRVESGDIVVNKIWARNGSVAVVPSQLSGCYGSSEFPTFVPIREKLDPRWFHWYTKQKQCWDQCDEKSQGTSGKNRIRPERFLEIQIPLPPLSDQRRIVARIEELAGKIEEAHNLRQQAGEEAEALRSAGRSRVFADCEKKFGARRLEELTTRVTKGESPEWQGFTYQETGPLFIRSENVLWGKLDSRNAARIPESFHEKLSRSQLRCGDVLINLVGASIGRTCVVPETIGLANINQAVAVITPQAKELSSEFLAHFLLSSTAQDVIHGGKVETARPNISLGDLRELRIPTPPLSEQRSIVAELDALQAQVDALTQLQAEAAAELNAMLPSILDKAFKGELGLR